MEEKNQDLNVSRHLRDSVEQLLTQIRLFLDENTAQQQEVQLTITKLQARLAELRGQHSELEGRCQKLRQIMASIPVPASDESESQISRFGGPTKETDLIDKLIFPVANLNFSVRTRNCLRTLGIHSIGQLVQKTEADLLRKKNFGRQSLKEVKDLLQSLGLHFNMVIPLTLRQVVN